MNIYYEDKKSQSHINSLDFIKICATYAIVFHHYQEFLQVKFHHFNFFYGVFPFHSMVFLFYTISGFLMAGYIGKIKDKSVNFEDFMSKRAYRLLPMTAMTAIVYEIVLIVFVMLTGITFSSYTTKIGIEGIGIVNGFSMLLTMTGTGAGWIWKGSMANEVTWYICVLLLCYFMFYICCRLAGQYQFKEDYAFAVMIVISLACASYNLALPFLNENSLQGYIPFFIGVLIGKFMKRRHFTANGAVLTLGIVGVLVSAAYIIGMPIFTKESFTDNYWLMFVTFPILIVVFLSRPIKGLFSARFWRIWGGVTFDIYVWHFICIILLIAVNRGICPQLPVGRRWFMIVFAGVVTLLGMLSYFFMEKRAEHFVRKLIQKIMLTEE